MKTKIGIVFPSIDHSQKVYDFTISAHKLLDSRSDVDVVAFYESLSQSFIPQRFGTSHISHIMSFDGILISCDAKSAHRLAGVITSSRRLFYPYDLEWRTNPPLPYEFLLGVYRDENLEVVARSPSHKWAIENCWNLKNVRVVSDFNLQELLWEPNQKT